MCSTNVEKFLRESLAPSDSTWFSITERTHLVYSSLVNCILFQALKLILQAWHESAWELLTKEASASTNRHSPIIWWLYSHVHYWFLMKWALRMRHFSFLLSGDHTQYCMWLPTWQCVLANCSDKVFTYWAHRLREKDIFLFSLLLVFNSNGHNTLYEIWLKNVKRNTNEMWESYLQIRSYFGLKPHKLWLLKYLVKGKKQFERTEFPAFQGI